MYIYTHVWSNESYHKSVLDVKEKIEHSDINEIRENLKGLLKDTFRRIVISGSSCAKLMYLSIFLVLMDAISYMRKYYSDDSFDNALIDHNLHDFWETEGRDKLTPMRKWELKERFQIKTSMKISKDEAVAMLWAAIPTLFAIIVVAAICISDYTLSEVIIFIN